MITITIVIAAYIANVFLARLIFKYAYRVNNESLVKKFLMVSFIPFVGIFAALLIFLDEYNASNNSWFNGKNW